VSSRCKVPVAAAYHRRSGEPPELCPEKRGVPMTMKPRPCERCKADIPVERLEALPETRLCVTCSRQVGGDYVSTVVAENLGKEKSFKKNYAGWAVKRTRRRIPPTDGE
jgi:hypothetical protein